MKPGAELRLATDDPSYLPWMVEHACTHPAFEWLAERPADWRTRPADWPPTRYEQKKIAGTPTFLRLGVVAISHNSEIRIHANGRPQARHRSASG